jgi:catechol 2,3-dioxygenase-like lactoylglutathione lyase family enzyme
LNSPYEKLENYSGIILFDIDVTRSFYVDVFGFEIKYERMEEGFARFTLDGNDIMVECLVGKERRWIIGEMERPFGRGVNFQWDVLDIEKIYSRVKATAPEAIYLDMEMKSYQSGNTVSTQKQFIAQDPDGYLFRFCCNVN